MQTPAQNKAAKTAQLVAKIKKKEAKLAQTKAELIRLVGDEGAVYDTDLGKVTVTKRTLDRSTDQFTYSLDSAKFIGLDERIQANLVRDGVISKKQKVIKGQAPVVKVALT